MAAAVVSAAASAATAARNAASAVAARSSSAATDAAGSSTTASSPSPSPSPSPPSAPPLSPPPSSFGETFLPVDKWTELDIVVLVLAGLYVLLALIPAVQLVRAKLRTRAWTTQQVFFVLIAVALVVRAAFFAMVPWITGNFFMLRDHPLFVILDTVPSVLFFSAFTLLVLFFAEIIHHAQNQSLSFPLRLRPIFMSVNIASYVILAVLWVLLFLMERRFLRIIDIVINAYLAFLYILAIVGFVYYGGRLYLALRRFPIASRGRLSKLREVGWVTSIVTTCYACRVAFLIFVSLRPSFDTQPLFIGAFFVVVELIPSALVLFVLRKLPPRPTQPGAGGVAGGGGAGGASYTGASPYAGAASRSPARGLRTATNYTAASQDVRRPLVSIQA